MPYGVARRAVAHIDYLSHVPHSVAYTPTQPTQPAESAISVESQACFLLLERSLRSLKRVRGTPTGTTPRRLSKSTLPRKHDLLLEHRHGRHTFRTNVYNRRSPTTPQHPRLRIQQCCVRMHDTHSRMRVLLRYARNVNCSYAGMYDTFILLLWHDAIPTPAAR